MQDIVYIVIIAGLALALFLLWQKSQKQQAEGGSKTGGQEIVMIQGQIAELRQTVDEKLGGATTMFQQQYSESAKLIQAVTAELTRVSEGQKQVMNVTEQLQSLQDILKNPKQRGVLGEYYLEALLKNVMPPGSYQMQYGFPNGTIVDAAVFVKDKIIPIDSKFSLENYNRIAETADASEKARLEKAFVGDLKNRIVETAKYIQPEQGTTDFAFMFIPHEAIYYDLLVNKIGAVTEDTENLVQRAAGKYKVIIVSPTSFLAYLQTVLQGLKAMQIEESAKLIIKRVEDLGRHLKAYDEHHTKLGNSLSATVNSYNASRKELGKIDKDVLRITGSSNEIDVLQLEKPSTLDEDE
ncbi:MAG TPA: DNA recombination protein RmuC [Candidatus Paceibacterota bacterium]